MERTFDFGTFKVDVRIEAVTPSGEYVGRIIIRAPGAEHVLMIGGKQKLLVPRARIVLEDMLRILRYGVQRFVSGRMMRERLPREEYENVRREAASLFRVAGAIGEKAIHQAIEALRAEEPAERAALEEEYSRVEKRLQQIAVREFDLGPAQARVELTGMLDPMGTPIWQVDFVIPGGPSYQMNYSMDASRYWMVILALLEELSLIFNLGIDRYIKERMSVAFEKDPDQSRAHAEALYAIATALGKDGIEEVDRHLNSEAKREEEEILDFKIKTLEAYREELINKLERLRTYRREDRGFEP